MTRSERLALNAEYWHKREKEALKYYAKNEAEYDRRIQQIYQDQLDAIEREINAFYGRYAAKEGITMAEARKRVAQADIRAYERKAKRYVEAAARDRAANGKTDKKGFYFSKRANEEMRLYNATMRINRLEMLKANIGLEMIKGHAELEEFMRDILDERVQEEIERRAGILGKTVRSNAKTAHAIPNASFHNATFSERIWVNQSAMRADLAKLIESGLIRGKNARELARDLRKYVGDSGSGATYKAERLMRTELARVQIEAQMQSYERDGIEYFEIIANSRCCDVCRALDGKVYKVSALRIGENAPPFHANCRCSTAPWEDSDEYEAWLDYVSKGGTTEEWDILKAAKESNRTRIQSGGKEITGGKHYEPYDRNNPKDVAAAKEYRKISRRNDIKVIAKNSGFSEDEIRQIKRHIFYDKHKKYEEYALLSPDYDMAVAWKRLYEGTQLERDILLLKHELLEDKLEKEYNLSIAEAHKRASEVYDWQAKLDEELGERGEPDGIL